MGVGRGEEGGGTQGSKVHYARRCANFNLQKEGGNKVGRRTFAKEGGNRDQESTNEGENWSNNKVHRPGMRVI